MDHAGFSERLQASVKLRFGLWQSFLRMISSAAGVAAPRLLSGGRDDVPSNGSDAGVTAERFHLLLVADWL